MATYLFVHGAFQGGWVWQKVTDLLRTKGHDTYTPTLSGCGYLAGKGKQDKNDLNDYITDIRDYIESEGLDEVILIAHSFSGMICGAVMMQIPDRIRHAVFVDAIIPEPQRSFADIAGESFRLILEKHLQEDGSVRPWPLPVFGVNGSDANWFGSRLRPFSSVAFYTPFPDSFDPHRIPTSYISCQMTASPFIREMAGKAKEFHWPLLTINTGHCPMVTCPVELAQALMMQTASAQDFYSFFE